MTDVTTWLSSALAEMREPDPAAAPLDLEAVLAGAFQHWDGRPLVDQVINEVWRQSGGAVSLQYSDPATFPTQVRGPAAYLMLSARRRLLLVPDPARPVQFEQ